MVKEFKSGAGAIFLSSKTGRVLLNLRAPHKSHNYTWSLWGGMLEDGEEPKDCLFRELQEEMGFVPEISKTYPFDIYESKDKNFRYYTFVCVVENEFIPSINHEAIGYSWVKLGHWPKPMHQGAKNTLCTSKALILLNIIFNQHK